MVILFQALLGLEQDILTCYFINATLDIFQDTLDLYLADKKAEFSGSSSGIRVKDYTPGACFNLIFKNSTANNN